MSLYISKYLTFEEATKSPTAMRLGINNSPDDTQLKNMNHTAQTIFDPVREYVNGPLLASSFFRCKALNDAVPGSSATSQHMTGEAIDIDADAYQYGTNISIFNFIKDNLDFDQLILEYPDQFGTPSWVHVSARRDGKNRKSIKVKLKNQYIEYSGYKIGMV